GWTAQLFSMPGSTIPVGPLTVYGVPVNDQFVAASPSTTFRTGGAAGQFAGATATLANVPLDSASAVLPIRVFPTVLGSWAATVAGFQAGNPLVTGLGASPMFVLNNIGGNVNTAPDLIGVVSFEILDLPEPTVFALFGLGLAGLCLLRKRSKGRC